MCNYCDFAKVFVNEQIIDTYVDALCEEMKHKKVAEKSFKSVYFGGGTPSTLKKHHLDKIFLQLKKPLNIDVEITFEMNPEDVSTEYLEMLAEFGVNRISLGVQTFSERLLKTIGRNHTKEHALKSIEILQQSTISNTTIDLMFALPGQTMEELKADIDYIVELALPHVSIYSLILEERTKLYIQQEQYQFLDEDDEAEMYEYVMSELQKRGYSQYEISNFSVYPKTQSQHNLAYWHQKEYLGIGLGAHEFIGNKRSANTKSITKYHRSLLQDNVIPVTTEEILTENQRFEEYCFLAFRDCQRGLDTSKLKQKYPEVYQTNEQKIQSILQKLEKEQLIEQKNECSFVLTKKGCLFANDVFSAFIQITE